MMSVDQPGFGIKINQYISYSPIHVCSILILTNQNRLGFDRAVVCKPVCLGLYIGSNKPDVFALVRTNSTVISSTELDFAISLLPVFFLTAMHRLQGNH